MPRRPASSPAQRRSAQAPGVALARRRIPRWLTLLAPAVVVATAGVGVWIWRSEDPARLASRAEASAKAGDWSDALRCWKIIDRSDQASAHSLLEEARASLALHRAVQAEHALIRSAELGPTNPAAWLLRLRLLHIENRALEAQQLGWAAYSAVAASRRQEILRALTLTLLTDPPDDFAREQLNDWVAADPADIDARVALLSRIATQPRGGDPDRASRVATLSSLLEQHPNHLAAREALVTALADAGELDGGREVLEQWPSSARDARYYRLRGRWDLDYDHKPAEAVDSFTRALTDQPHDWRTHYRLSRTLSTLGRMDEARREADRVARLRESLEPANLGHRLATDFDHFDDPKSRLDLAALCASVGLDRLAEAWRLEAAAPSAADSFGQGFGTPPFPSRTR